MLTAACADQLVPLGCNQIEKDDKLLSSEFQADGTITVS
jgi:hypothetical protein